MKIIFKLVISIFIIIFIIYTFIKLGEKTYYITHIALSKNDEVILNLPIAKFDYDIKIGEFNKEEEFWKKL